MAISRFHGIALLLTVWLVAFAPGATMPTVHGDEWGRVAEVFFGTFTCPSSNNVFLRPLLGCYVPLLNKLFGLNIQLYHQLSLFWHLAAAFLFYLLLKKFIPRSTGIPLVSALLFLIYPTAFVHPFFERGPYQISLILFLGAYLLALQAIRANRNLYWIGATLLLTLSLVLYEAHLGVVLLLLSLLLVQQWLTKPWHTQPAIWMLVMLLIALVFAVGRWSAQLTADSAFGHATAMLSASPLSLLQRLFTGYRISLQWGWTGTINNLVPYYGWPGYLKAIALGVLVLIGVSLVVLSRTLRGNKDRTERPGKPTPSYRALIGAGLIALAAIGAGYIPMILAVSPALDYVSGRINIIPGLGAAVLCGILLHIIYRLCRFPEKYTAAGVIALALPLLIVAGAAQRQAQLETSRSWNLQKEIWHQIISEIPSLEAETTLILLVPDAAAAGQFGARPFESGGWGFRSALQTLYGQKALDGRFVYAEIDELNLTAPGLLDPTYPWTGRLIPYDKSVLVRYLFPQGSIEHLNVVKRVDLDGSIHQYRLCDLCVLEHVPTTPTLRSWIE